jgi:hypothetical protein
LDEWARGDRLRELDDEWWRWRLGLRRRRHRADERANLVELFAQLLEAPRIGRKSVLALLDRALDPVDAQEQRGAFEFVHAHTDTDCSSRNVQAPRENPSSASGKT